MKKVIISLLFLLLLQIGLSRAATIDPSFRFSTIETDHFSIHFHQGLGALVQRAAEIAEDVHTTLVSEFKWELREKTQIVLIDDTDLKLLQQTILLTVLIRAAGQPAILRYIPICNSET